ncbi:MAG: 3-deoxy-8-phosphooctulonate synthase [Bacteroidales bacterium]|nr:3-deoxy-8-phosphooctulonate synthase [Bacteroidales bacterium]
MSIPDIPGLKYRESNNFLLLAGPCVVESEELVREVADEISRLCNRMKIPFVLKASYRKANRSRQSSFSGIGDTAALKILKEAGEAAGVPVVTDIHSAAEAEMAARYVDILQIPAFLCRQTDILEAAGETGKWVNIKKGQFLSGASMIHAVEKVRKTGNNKIILTDRGNMFGYSDLVVDMRNIPEMKETGVPVIMDITHSLQQPNQPDGVSGGRPEMIETIALAALAAGADGIFIESHPDPSTALSDGANMLKLSQLKKLLEKMIILREAVNRIRTI